MYVAPFSLSSFSVSHLHPSLPTYLYVHFSTLESFKLSSTWAFAYIRTYPCACIPCIRACLRTRTTRSFPNSGESTYHRLFIYQPSSAFSTINPIILDRYFLFLLSFFFFLSSKSRTRIVPIIFVDLPVFPRILSRSRFVCIQMTD